MIFKMDRKIIISYWNPRDSVRCVLTKTSYWLRKLVVGIYRFHVMRRSRILQWSKYHWICCWFFFIIFVKYHIFIRLFFTDVYFSFSPFVYIYRIFDLSFVDMMTSLEKCNVRYQNWFFPYRIRKWCDNLTLPYFGRTNQWFIFNYIKFVNQFISYRFNIYRLTISRTWWSWQNTIVFKCQREIILSIFQWISKTKIMTKFIFTRLFPRTDFTTITIWLIMVAKVLTIFQWYFKDQKLYPRDWKNFTDERHTNRIWSITWHSWNITHDNSLECMRSSFFVIDTWLKSFFKSFIFASSEIFMKQRDRTETNYVSKSTFFNLSQFCPLPIIRIIGRIDHEISSSNHTYEYVVL